MKEEEGTGKEGDVRRDPKERQWEDDKERVVSREVDGQTMTTHLQPLQPTTLRPS